MQHSDQNKQGTRSLDEVGFLHLVSGWLVFRCPCRMMQKRVGDEEEESCNGYFVHLFVKLTFESSKCITTAYLSRSSLKLI